MAASPASNGVAASIERRVVVGGEGERGQFLVRDPGVVSAI